MPRPVYDHQQVALRFRRTLERGRLASTYLFVGPEGVGKRTFARWLASSLLCHDSPSDSLEPCGACESCRLFDAGTHPDLLEVAKPEGKSTLPLELFIGKDDKRNREGLCHDIALKPYLGKRRVAIIDDADSLSTESANCLLKTLEEPPPRSLLVLIGTSLSKQLPTIRSRCQVVRFGPLQAATVARVLEEQSLLEEGEDAQTLSQAAHGSVAAALQARDHEAREFQTNLLRKLAAPQFDPVRLGSEVNAFCSTSGVEPAVKRRRLNGLMAAAVESYRQSLRGEGPLAPPVALECLEQCVRAETALHRNANQATLIQAWLTGLWRAHRA